MALYRRREPASRAPFPSARARKTTHQALFRRRREPALRAPLPSVTAFFWRRGPVPQAPLPSALGRESAHQAPLPPVTCRAAPRLLRLRVALCSEGAPPPPLRPADHVVAVGLRYGKANTETLRSRLQIDLAFPRNSGGRSTLFPTAGRRCWQGWLPRSPSPAGLQRGSPLGGHFVATNPSPVFEAVYWICRPSLVVTHATPRAQPSFGSSEAQKP